MGTRLDVGVIALGAAPERWHPDYISGTAGTDYTEQGPRPGTPTTTASLPRLQPQIVGAQSVDLRLLVMEAGFPKVGGSGLQVGYYLSGDSTNDARGYMIPTFFSDYRAPFSSAARRADAAVCPLCGRIALQIGVSSTEAFSVFNPHTNAFENTATVGSLTRTAAAMTFVPGTERLLWIAHNAAWYSDDHGATWTQYDDEGPSSVVTSPTYTSDTDVQSKYRAAFDGAGNLLWVGHSEDVSGAIDFVASSDQGASWSLVERHDPAGVGVLVWDIAAHPDGSIAYVYNDSNDLLVRFKRLGGAFDAQSAQDSVTIATMGAVPDALAVGCDENGTIWVYIVEAGGPPSTTRSYFSTDGGSTWTLSNPLGNRNGNKWWQMRLVPHPFGGLGGALSTVSAGDRGGLVQLGGWAGPGRSGNDWADSAGSATDSHWIAMADPATWGLTKTGASTDTLVHSGGTAPFGYWRVQSGAGAAQGYWERTVYTTDRAQGAAEWICRIPDDGGTTSAAPSASGIGVRLQARDAGANQRRTVVVYMDEAGYRVWDEEAAAWLGAKIAVDLTQRTHFRLSFSSAATHVAHRQDATSKTKWTLATYAALSTAATAATGVIWRWGHLTGVANTESHWWRADGRGEAAAPLQGTSNTGVGLGPYSYPIPDAHDSTALRLSRLLLRGGPAFTGEVWTINRSFDYPISALFPLAEANMDRTWRSSGSGTETVLCNFSDSHDTVPDGTSIALAVRNCNVRQVQLIAQTAASATSVIGTLDLATGFTNVAFARSENVITPNATYTSGRFIAANSLRGGHFYDSGSSIAREIEGNTAGFFSSAASVKCAIFLKGDASGMGASGNGYIAWPAGVLLVHQAPTVAKRRRWGIRIVSQPFDATSRDGSYGLKAQLFNVRVPGKSFDKGVEWSLRPNVRSGGDERGTDRRERKGPMRRMLTIPWEHGADMEGFRGTRGDATEYVGPAGSGAPALAVRDDVWQQLIGLYSACGDGSRLVLAILKESPDWSSGSQQAAESINDPTAFIVGYLDADLRATLARGKYGTEFMMPGPLRIVEAV